MFKGWSGDASGIRLTSNAITMDGPKTATANWKTQYQVSFAVTPSGSGSVNPSKTIFYDADSSISISSTAKSRYIFSSFKAALSPAKYPVEKKPPAD
jgi:uncharacterized repeat protein (TIGR02543 family)